MNVNGIKFYNSYDIDTNNKCQMSKPVKFGTSKDGYFSSQKKEDEASQKKKRNWIIGGICAVVAAAAVGFLYYNGKKVNKAVNKVENVGNAENLEEQASKIAKKVQQYADYINPNKQQKKLDAKTLRTNIKEMNELLEQSPNDETSQSIFNIMLTSFIKLINLHELTVQERIKDLEDYSSFLECFDVNDPALSPSRINANKTCLEFETNIMQNDINKNIENLTKVIKDENIETEYKKEFIENLLEKEEKSKENTDKILQTITDNTKIDESVIIKKDQELVELIGSKTEDAPESLPVYLNNLKCKNLENIEKNVDKSLWIYDILTVNRLKKLVSELLAYEAFNYYTIDEDKNILIGKKDGMQATFNFKTQECGISRIEEIDEKDKTELEETLKDTEKSLKAKRKAIIKMFRKYQGNPELIKTFLEIINQNTSENDIEKAKRDALKAFKDSLKDDYSEQNVIKCLQETINKFYKQDNSFYDLLPYCLVGEKIESAPECNDFDDKDIGLTYGLGVCRHMAKLVNYLITSLKQEGIQVCSIDNGEHSWNYLRFKKDDGSSYTYHGVDTYFQKSLTLNGEKEILEAFKTRYEGDVTIDSVFEMACY